MPMRTLPRRPMPPCAREGKPSESQHDAYTSKNNYLPNPLGRVETNDHPETLVLAVSVSLDHFREITRDLRARRTGRGLDDMSRTGRLNPDGSR